MILKASQCFMTFDQKTSITHIIDVIVIVSLLLLRMLYGSGTSKSDAQDQAALLLSVARLKTLSKSCTAAGVSTSCKSCFRRTLRDTVNGRHVRSTDFELVL